MEAKTKLTIKALLLGAIEKCERDLGWLKADPRNRTAPGMFKVLADNAQNRLDELLQAQKDLNQEW